MSVETPEVEETQEVFERWEPEIRRAADIANVDLPQPSTHSSPVNSQYGHTLYTKKKPAWENKGHRSRYLVDALWTLDDIRRTNPQEKVSLGVKTPYSRRGEGLETFYEHLTEEYNEDSSVEVRYGPHLIPPIIPSDLIVEVPAERIEEVADVEVNMPERGVVQGIEGLRFNSDPASEKLKKTEFVNALLGPWREDLEETVIPEYLSYQELFGSEDEAGPEPRTSAEESYVHFLQDMREGKVFTRNLYRNLASRV